MEGKGDRLRAIEGDDPVNSTVEFGNNLLTKMIFKIEKLLR